MMLDAKILAAVLTSLTAVAATTGGGTVEKSDVNSLDLSNLEKPMSSDLLNNILSMVQSSPEPKTDFRANLTVDEISEKDIKIRGAELRPSNLTQLKTGGNKLSSDKEIVLKGFNGLISFKNGTTIKGSASLIQSSGVNISGDVEIGKTAVPSKINLSSVKRINLKYPNVTGSVSTGSKKTEIQEDPVEIKSFSGTVAIYPEENRIFLEGKVYSLKSGDLKLGG